ncbi:MAG: site-specific integrase [Candidatus Limiplasma sp.]|nr:site-specific integrase [Candidatus Limiplasma sp.]
MPSFFYDKARQCWVCQYKDPTTGKYVPQRGFARKKDAQEWYHASGYDLEAGAIKPAGKMTVGEWLDTWWETYCTEAAMEPSTRRGYRIYIDHHLKPEVGHILLVDLRPHHVRKMLANLSAKKKPAKDPEKAQPYKPSTISQIYTGFRAAMNQAVADDLIRKSPCLKVPGPEVVSKKPTYCAADTVQTLIQEMEGTKFFMPIYLCIMLGIRRGEALGLKWEDIDGGTVHIRKQIAADSVFEGKKAKRQLAYKDPKTPRSVRDLNIPPDLQAALARHRKRQIQQRLLIGPAYQNEGYICADEGGGVLSPDCVSRAAKNFLRKVGAPPGTRLHNLRHTHGTLLRQAGFPVEVIADVLGDTVATVQKYYIGEDTGKKRAAALAVNDIFKVK